MAVEEAAVAHMIRAARVEAAAALEASVLKGLLATLVQ
jgi:hypothetical protein